MTLPRQTSRPLEELVGEYSGVVRILGWRNVAVCSWSGQATGPAAALVAKAMDRSSAQGRRQTYIHLIRDKLALPDPAAREGFIDMMKQRHADLACVAIVVGGTGFWASAMRNAVIGLRVFGPRNFEFRLHGRSEEILEWLPTAHERQTGVALPVEILMHLLALPQPDQSVSK